MESFKPIFIVLAVLVAAGLVFLALRLDKTPVPEGQIYNWKRI